MKKCLFAMVNQLIILAFASRIDVAKRRYMTQVNYKKIYAMKRERESQISRICPGITNNSGIYVFSRIDETGIKFCYCGQARHLRERCASHLGEYDHIALSLKKRGFHSEENPYGWKLMTIECEESRLDAMERAYIKEYANNGYQLFNKFSGGQGEGKVKINDFKQPRTYRDGLKQGKKMLARELSHIIEKHLEIRLKEGKEHNKISQKALEKFMSLLDEVNYETE